MVMTSSSPSCLYRPGHLAQPGAGLPGPVAPSGGRAEHEGGPAEGGPGAHGEEDVPGQGPGPEHPHAHVPGRGAGRGHAAQASQHQRTFHGVHRRGGIWDCSLLCLYKRSIALLFLT